MLTTAFTSETEIQHPTRNGMRAAPLGEGALDERFAAGIQQTLEAREHLFCEGDRATHVYRVEVGHICIYRMMPDGRRQVVDFAYPGDVIGLGALAEHGDSAQAMERTIVRALALAPLRDVARTDSRLGLNLYEALSRELMATRELLFTVSQRTATERIAAFLMALSRRNARRGGKADEIVLPMTRLDIADFLGLTIETVSRTLTRLRIAGVIDLEQCILITIRDPRTLEALSQGTPLGTVTAQAGPEACRVE